MKQPDTAALRERLVRLEQDRINISIESVRVGNSIYELKRPCTIRTDCPVSMFR